MNKPYKNIISTNIVSYSKYLVLAEYATLDEAEKNLMKDVESFKERYGDAKWYKLFYPFAWATIKETLPQGLIYEGGSMKKYRLIMTIPNIKHKSWWWNGQPIYGFDTVDELLCFMKSKIPMCQRDIELIRNNDSLKENGRIACTSWYDVEKGEDQMTEYTSF